jgi:crossover junction endodeoxyribonuclease RuvC
VRILGIDPGSRITGYAVVEASGNAVTYIECGVLELDIDAPVAARLAEIRDQLDVIIRELCPAVAAVEGVFIKHNPRTALKLGQARGVALACAGAAGLAVHEYPPATVKQSVVGRGNATKEQVQHMVRALLGLRSVPRVDAADALAVAITHAHVSTAQAARERAMAAGRGASAGAGLARLRRSS